MAGLYESLTGFWPNHEKHKPSAAKTKICPGKYLNYIHCCMQEIQRKKLVNLTIENKTFGFSLNLIINLKTSIASHLHFILLYSWMLILNLHITTLDTFPKNGTYGSAFPQRLSPCPKAGFRKEVYKELTSNTVLLSVLAILYLRHTLEKALTSYTIVFQPVLAEMLEKPNRTRNLIYQWYHKNRSTCK